MSRYIVWALVGIVVIVGIVLFVTAPKKAPASKLTLDLVKSGVADADTQMGRLVARADAARRHIAPGAGSQSLVEADSLLAQAREKLGQADTATDLKQATQLLTDGRVALRKARRAVELATKPGSRPPGSQ
ncbi:MAG TPA: hypothetical protein VMH22_10370 [bacterium]|nr:hypothetical protein [bacterium]